ncbi:hypothetical protein DUI87_35519 [Hirundo rustica rustica]|uniref:Uncharacterized protein n=1 Tax=Hirundo rustica rustica TaxID=333673 RepID=A0A3M0IJ17_HIRRU|nr:hypothetical protein DUI87_35519 [Hirundo rustica rustica]
MNLQLVGQRLEEQGQWWLGEPVGMGLQQQDTGNVLMVLGGKGMLLPNGLLYSLYLWLSFANKQHRLIDLRLDLPEFLDDTKLGVSVDVLEGRRALQKDLDRLDPGTKSNNVRFNKSKCQVRYLSYNNPCSATGWGQ